MLLLILTFAALGLSNLALGTMVISPSRVPFGLPARVFSGFMFFCWGLYGSAWVVLIGCALAAITHHWRLMRRELNLLGGWLGFSLLPNLIAVNLPLSAALSRARCCCMWASFSICLCRDFGPFMVGPLLRRLPILGPFGGCRRLALMVSPRKGSPASSLTFI